MDDKETIDILLTKGVDKIVTDLASLFKSDGWKKVEVFNPGEELLKL